MRASVFSLIALLCLGFSASQSLAAPWAETGDRRLKSDLELLADYGVISGPVTSWPIPWKQISAGLEVADDKQLPPYVRAAMIRVRKLMPGVRAEREFRSEMSFSATNEESLVRDFSDSARTNAETSLRIERQWNTTYISLGVGYRDDARNGNLNFDRSYLAKAFGNWVVYGGYVEQWWGPGWDSALIFSNNARPAPKVGFKRLNPEPFESKWLSWIGPWQVEAFVSLLDETREYSNQFVAGMRLMVEPIDRLEIGFTRALQLCGEGRPCGFGTWKDSLIGIANADNTGTLNEPGNQLAGVDFRFSRHMGGVAASLYGQISGEDEDNLVIDQIAVLAGLRLSGGIGGDGGRWQAVAEYSDTLANGSFFGGIRVGSTYYNFIYTDGFTYRGRALGASLGGDSKLMSLTGSYTSPRNWTYQLAVRRADINQYGSSHYPYVSLSQEKINMLEMQVDAPTRWGDLHLEMRLADDSPNSPGKSDASAGFEIGWKTYF